MALQNECVSCEELFTETKDNPGCVCKPCRQAMSEQEKLHSEEEFWARIEKIIEHRETHG